MRWSVLPLALLLVGCAAPPPAEPGAIVAFGDSYTSGTGARREEAYPARLAAALGRPVVNAGVHGETAEEALRRIERDVLRHEPTLVIVEFGVNEAYRGHPVERSTRAIEEIVERSQARGAKVVIVGVHFWDFQEEFDAGLQDIATRRGTGLVLDVLEGIVASRQGERADASLRSDEFHPNAKGYAIMAERIEPEVRRVLG